MGKRLVVGVVLMLMGVIPVSARDWLHEVNNESGTRTATITASGRSPGGVIQTSLTIHCRAGNDGAAGMIYRVSDADKVRLFRFDAFDGPSATGTSKKLATFRVRTSTGVVAVTTPVTGSYTSDGAFEFKLSANPNIRTEFTRLVDAIVQGAQEISVIVRQVGNQRRTIQTTFPAYGSSVAVYEVVKGCGLYGLKCHSPSVRTL